MRFYLIFGNKGRKIRLDITHHCLLIQLNCMYNRRCDYLIANIFNYRHHINDQILGWGVCYCVLPSDHSVIFVSLKKKRIYP
jgi:hypothetical protein